MNIFQGFNDRFQQKRTFPPKRRRANFQSSGEILQVLLITAGLLLGSVNSARATSPSMGALDFTLAHRIEATTARQQITSNHFANKPDHSHHTSQKSQQQSPGRLLNFQPKANPKHSSYRTTPSPSQPTITDHTRLMESHQPHDQSKQPNQANSIFSGGSASLVARTVGHAEGTRNATGEPTWAYWGHIDPGNQAWNQGTFSYQHAASSPEDADKKQLKRLKRQAQELEHQAQTKGIKLSLLEQLNGIDLANQAPLAALDRGYIDWLAQTRLRSLPEEEAILWARTWSYWDPDRQQWNAPGLGNTFHNIRADQKRRQHAIATVLERYSTPAILAYEH